VIEISEDAVRAHRDPEVAFMNVNTPEELARARVLQGHVG
jgi:molybdopterin-guanine dinucleotide biosynthesis protein A